MINVIIPIYHSRETLPYTLNSLVAQTKKGFMTIIVNDADNEDYTDIIEEYERRGLIITYLKTDINKGPGVARQLGMDSIIQSFATKVNGLKNQYVTFLDSDDMLQPRAIEILGREISITQSDIITSSFIVEHTGDLPTYMDVNNSPVTWCIGKIYKLEYLVKNDIRFDEELKMNEDSYFNLVAMNCTKNKKKITEYLGVVRDNKDSLTRKIDEEGDFFTKSADQYVLSQIRGLVKITNVLDEIPSNLVAATYINIYKHMMKARRLNVILPKSEKEFYKIQNNQILQEAKNEEMFWQTIVGGLPACEMYKDHIIFYDMIFTDWLKDYIDGGQI